MPAQIILDASDLAGRGTDSEARQSHNGVMAGLEAIKYERGKLEVLDQLRLPHEFVYDQVSTCEEAFDCIKAMRVRGTCVHLSHSRSRG